MWQEMMRGFFTVDEHYFKTQAITQGKFVELECMTDIDAGGYEIVYWNVNKIGNIAGWAQPASAPAESGGGESESSDSSSSE